MRATAPWALGAMALLPVLLSSPAEACVWASEADQLLGWTEDGRYALYARSGRDAHAGAEIIPTQLREDPVYWISREDSELVVRAKPQVACQPWTGGIVERKPIGRGVALTVDVLAGLDTVRKLGFRPRGAAAGAAKASSLVVSFQPRRRYADHRVVIKDPAGKYDATLDLPVGCVGSCLRDEDWKTWTVQVVGVHEAGGLVLYELKINRMCNGGRDRDMWMIRLVAARSPGQLPPKRRCKFGAGA